jgi:hypothetical protein
MTTLYIKESCIPDLSSKTAVITGGSDGIGLGAVETFLVRNARVFILDIKPPPAAVLSHPNVQYIPTNISSWSALTHAFSTICITHNASIDIAIANAAVTEEVSYLSSCLQDAPGDEGEWAILGQQGPPSGSYKCVDVNLLGTLNFLMLAVRVMKRQVQGGSIVVTTSATAYLPEQSIPLYCSLKGAVGCTFFYPSSVFLTIVVQYLLHDYTLTSLAQLTTLIRTLRTTLPLYNIAISGVAPSATFSASLPSVLSAPLLEAKLPISSPRHVGLAIVYSATATQKRRVENYGKDEETEHSFEER